MSTVINPITKRPIKVGGRVWNKLVADGLFQEDDDPKIVGEIDQDMDEDGLDQEINEVNKTLPITQHAVRGRGKYKGKIVTRDKQPSIEEITQYTAKKGAGVVKEKLSELNELAEDDMEEELERIILEELKNIEKPKLERAPTKVSKLKKISTQKYVLEDPPEFDDYEEEYEDEGDESSDW